MAQNRSSVKFVALGIVVVGVVGVAVYLPKRHKQSANTQPVSSAPKVTVKKPAKLKSTSAGTVTSADYNYPLPAGWSLLDQQQVASLAASSGIIQSAKPNSKFVVTADPVGADSQTLYQAKSTAYRKLSANLQNFRLVSELNITVSGAPAVQYTYLTLQVKQRLVILLHKDKVYSLLFTTNTNNFDSQTKVFDKILTGFKFAN